jgi:phosphohistidine phosphatase SixA
MIVYLVRHSVTVKDGKNGDDDEDRDLTDEGKYMANEVACGLEHLIDKEELPRKIFSSPAARCMQTALIIRHHWEQKPEIEVEDCFAEGSPVADQVKYLMAEAGDRPVMVVGHKHELIALTNELIGGEGACIDYKRMSLARIEFKGEIKGGKGELVWLYPPCIMRKFA